MSLALKLEIALGNDAMQTGTDVSEAIITALPIGSYNMDAPMVVGDAGPIRDVNGNTVGRWFVDAA